MLVKNVRLFSRNFPEIKKLYKSAFPPNETYPLEILTLMTLRKQLIFRVFYDDETLCGFIYYCLADQTIYVSYLAINDAIRGKGYGTKLINWLLETYPEKQIVLNVEPLDEKAANYDQRQKRVRFYERNGFYLTPHRLKEPGGEYATMANKGKLPTQNFKKVMSVFSWGLFDPIIEQDATVD